MTHESLVLLLLLLLQVQLLLWLDPAGETISGVMPGEDCLSLGCRAAPTLSLVLLGDLKVRKHEP